MANYVSKKLGQINDPLVNKIQIDGSSVMTGPVNKAWRSLILLHRATHGPTDHANKRRYREKDPAKGEPLLIKQKHRENDVIGGKAEYVTIDGKPLYVEFQGDKDKGDNIPTNTKPLDDLIREKGKYMYRNNIIIYNLLQGSKYQYIVLQNRPTSLDFKGETYWAAIKSMGRNTPMYHYTGAEDTLQFNISWYANDPEHPDDVINKCRLLESWSKANGYKASPPILKLQWGSMKRDNPFQDHLYILISATYTLMDFNDCIRGGETKGYQSLKTRGLYPAAATQELVFKRVSDINLEYGDILSEDKMEHTRGINK